MSILAAFVASLALHVGVLLSPGWSRPFDEEPEGRPLDAVLAPAPSTADRPVPAVPSPRTRASSRPAAPATPVAHAPDEPVAEPMAQSTPEPAAAPESEAGTAPPAQTLPAVSPEPTFYSGAWPRRGRIVFEVTRGEDFIVGRSEHVWEHDGVSYRLRAVTETTGLAALFRPARVEQESRGGFAKTGLKPREFESWRDGKPKDSLRFDPAVSAQDMLSLFHHLGALIDAPLPATVTVAAGRKLNTYALTDGGSVPLETAGGVRQARHLKIAGEDATEVWLDLESRLPLRIRHHDRKGEVFDQVAKLMEVDKL